MSHDTVQHDGPAFGGSEYIDPREGIQTADPREIAERLAADRVEARRTVMAEARAHYATLAAAHATYRAFGAARDTEGDYIAAWIAWHEDGNDGPPPAHATIMDTLAAQADADPATARRIARYVTPDGCRRTRPAPIGTTGIRGGHAVPSHHYGDHSRFAPVSKQALRFDAVHARATRLWDGTLRTQAAADKQQARLADDIAHGHRPLYTHTRGYQPR